MTNDDTTIDVDGIESEKLKRMEETISNALMLAEDYLHQTKGTIPESTTERSDAPVTREDCEFDMDEEDVLFDAWQMLRYLGASKDDLQTLTRIIEADTIYDETSLDHYYTEVVVAE